MPTQRALKGVAHNIAHHTQSGLSWIHPHFAEACREVGVFGAGFELLCEKPYPHELPKKQPLQLALQSLHKKLLEILERSGFPSDAVSSVHLDVQFPRFGGDDYTCSVRATITSSNGKQFESTVE
jgi:hypothetical protein